MHINKLIDSLVKIREQDPDAEVLVRESHDDYTSDLIGLEAVKRKVDYYDDNEVRKEKESAFVHLVYEGYVPF